MMCPCGEGEQYQRTTLRRTSIDHVMQVGFAGSRNSILRKFHGISPLRPHRDILLLTNINVFYPTLHVLLCTPRKGDPYDVLPGKTSRIGTQRRRWYGWNGHKKPRDGIHLCRLRSHQRDPTKGTYPLQRMRSPCYVQEEDEAYGMYPLLHGCWCRMPCCMLATASLGRFTDFVVQSLTFSSLLALRNSCTLRLVESIITATGLVDSHSPFKLH